MLRIIKSIVTIVAVAAIATTATGAYFSDTETSTGNSFTAGTLDLKVDNQDDPTVVHVTRTDMIPYPGWSHSYGGQWILKNNGSIPGKFTVKIKNIKNLENGCIDPENLDTTCGSGDDQGELGSQMFGKWMENHWGIYSPAKGWAGSAVFNPLNTAQDQVVDGITLNPGDLLSAYLDLEWPSTSDNNLAQGDSIEFDIEFTLTQV